VYSLAVPNCVSYDPAYAYELAVIIQDGIRRMYMEQESVFYYLTVMNEQYEMPPMPAGSREGILKGLYRFNTSPNTTAKRRAQLLGSGAILNEVIAAQKLLEKYGVAADVWSVTSYQELYRDAHAVERWNMLHPTEKPRVPYVTQCLKDTSGVIVAASDYLKVLPGSLDRWMPRRVRSLGTDGFGRSEDRASLRDFFEVDARFVAVATLTELVQEGQIEPAVVASAIRDFGINPEKPNPAKS
jgi:pyruvate dehydrogenase E1 component